MTPTDYTFTGQKSYAGSFGLLYYNARWVDPFIGRFAQADTIIPEQSQGTQAWDRYAYTNNNPVSHTDPTGHCISDPASFALCVGVATIVGMGLSGLVDAAFQAVDIASGKQDSYDAGRGGAAILSGGFFAGAIAGAPATVMGVIVTSLVAGGLAGQIDAVAEGVFDEALIGNYSTTDALENSYNNGYLDLGTAGTDALTGLVSVGITRGATRGFEMAGLIQNPNFSGQPGIPIIAPKIPMYKPFIVSGRVLQGVVNSSREPTRQFVESGSSAGLRTLIEVSGDFIQSGISNYIFSTPK